MSAQSSSDGPDLGRTTIVCSWTFTALATLGVCAQLSEIRHHGLGYVKLDDYLIIISFMIALILVSQTTWAILDEGQGKHAEGKSRTQLAMIAKVYMLQG